MPACAGAAVSHNASHPCPLMEPFAIALMTEWEMRIGSQKPPFWGGWSCVCVCSVKKRTRNTLATLAVIGVIR